MNEARSLRLSILMALASSGALAAFAPGCGGEADTSRPAGGGGAGGAGSTGSASIGSTVTSSAAGTTSTGVGGGDATSTGVGGSGTTTVGVGGAGGGAGGSTSVATGAGGTTSASTASSTAGVGGAGGAPSCNGFPAKQSCYTLEQLEWMLKNPPMGGDRPFEPDAGAEDGGTGLTECPEASKVQNDCCIPAIGGPEEQGDVCCYWFCEGACCGRPFIVEGTLRTATPARRADWTSRAGNAREDQRAPLDDATREALARAWLRDATMEHASIASFARFSLELLALGAPAELVEQSQRASLDEIEHARLCFAIASRLSGAPVGPSALPVSGCERGGSLAESVVAAVAEGCVGETIAALVAREQLARATEPDVRAALERIARDEEQHAMLAYRFVRWAIEVGGDDVRRAARTAFEHAASAARAAPIEAVGPVDALAWAEHGRLDGAELASAIRAALDDVIAPCAAALLA